MSTITLSELIGREVVSGTSAETIGDVKSLILDRSAHRVQRMQVGGSKRKPELVEWGNIDSVGADAVLVNAGDDVHGSEDDEDELYTRGDIEIIGAPVLDTLGFVRGTVVDMHVDSVTGEVQAFMTDDDGRIPIDRVHSLGTYALVVTPG